MLRVYDQVWDILDFDESVEGRVRAVDLDGCAQRLFELDNLGLVVLQLV